ncbi:MAG: hypothetical protein KIT82_14985 [Bradyrhizobium sp.]|nr:hypothetical protein [Bradyrhizobium sp.]
MQDNEEVVEPDAILLQFAAELPITIKNVVLPRCCSGLGLLEGRPGQDFFETLRSTLKCERHRERPWKVAILCGVMELALEHEEGDQAWLSELAAKYPEDETFAHMALQAPLKDKHWQLAREEFAQLRAGILSSQALRAWQMYLMAKYPTRIPSFRNPFV